jgi:hypothetical protein
MMTPAPTFRGRVWCWTKRLFKVGLLLLIAAAPTVYFGAPVLARQEKTRHRFEAALARTLGTPVEITSMAWSWKDGLTIQDFRSIALKVETLRIQPNFLKMVRGKSGMRVFLDSPHAAVLDTDASSPELRLPKFCRKGLRLEDVEVRNGTYTVMSADGTRRAVITGISTDGSGRLANRAADLTLSSFSASFNGLALTGRGVLHLTQEGLTGELEVNEAAAAQSSDLQNALKASKITLKQGTSETRWY